MRNLFAAFDGAPHPHKMDGPHSGRVRLTVTIRFATYSMVRAHDLGAPQVPKQLPGACYFELMR